MAKRIKIAELVAEAKLDNRRYRQSLKGMQSSTNRGVGQMVKRIGTLAVAFIGVRKAIDFVKNSIIGTTAQFESLNLRFEQLIGNTGEAKRQFAELVKFSTKTPFKIQEVVEAAATLEAFGASSEDLISTMGDLAAFMGITIPEASAAFGRAFAAGAGAADILRERGVLNLIKLQTGIDDLTKLTLPEFRQAMIDAMTDPDGRISGGAAKLAETLAGKWSTFVGEVDLLWVSIGDRWQVQMKRMVDTAIIAVRLIRESLGQLATAVKNDFEEAKPDDSAVTTGLKFLRNKYFEMIGFIGKQTGKLFQFGFKASLPETTKVLQELKQKFNEEVGKLDTGGKLVAPLIVQKPVTDKEPVDQIKTGLEGSTEAAKSLKDEMDNVGASINQAAGQMGRFIGELQEGRFSLGGFLSLLALVPGLGSLGVAGSFLSGAGFKHGGTATVGQSGITRAATGLSGMVPTGFPNDNFLIGVTSGERVNVETRSQANANDRGNQAILKSLSVLNMNVTRMGERQDIIEATVSVEDRQLQLLVEKSQSREARFS